ncbi:hypothetical protein CRG98_000076 [Punica granatum]|uniref:Calmodulin binding protein-like N-terminal domain-containing protein n=1 Tax=Punica granatum TaxID=22663 RepID=A0A2I0LFZ7_PUNGR|nr:hypothetical protein CRG98_000076 [Punica granatum]
MDVNSAFPNCVLDEEAYVDQPKGYVKKEQEGLVYKLRKISTSSSKHRGYDGYLEDNSNSDGRRLKLTKEGSGADVNPAYFKRLAWSLRYLTSPRPDFVYSVGLVSKFMESPIQSHLQVTKRILPYIKAFSWSPKKQQVVALSIAEAEYIVTDYCATQAVWLHQLLVELHHEQMKLTVIKCDNKSTIALAKNPVFHGRSKHIDIKYHFIRYLVKSGETLLEFCKSENQAADMFMKSLKEDIVLKLKSMIAMVAGQEVEGEHGSLIHVFLVDLGSGDVVQDRTPSAREDFEVNETNARLPVMTGELQVALKNGMGTLGAVIFNYESRIARSGKFRLGVKTDTRDNEGVHILEGISNEFIVEWKKRRHDDGAADLTGLPEDLSPESDMDELSARRSPRQNFVDSEAELVDQFLQSTSNAEVE